MTFFAPIGSRLIPLAAFLCAIMGAPLAIAQCPQPGWQPTHWFNEVGVSGTVQAVVMWDPDGPGPRPADIVVAGDIGAQTNSGAAFHVASWNGSLGGGWSAFGSGMNTGATVRALAVLPTGELVAGGDFTTADGTIVNGVARWNGSMWVPFGTGLTGISTPVVYSMLALPNGDLIVGGEFTGAGGVPVSNIARWSGAPGGGWSALASGFNNRVSALTLRNDASIVAGGKFTLSGNVAINHLARWNGSDWESLGLGIGGGDVFALATQSDGDLIVGGNFALAGGITARAIARWSDLAGGAWHAFVPAISSQVNSLLALPDGGFLAGGNFVTDTDPQARGFARWNGSTWIPFGNGLIAPVNAIALDPAGDIIIGGRFDQVAYGGVGRWTGTQWRALSKGIGGIVSQLRALPTGEVIAGGEFTLASGLAADHIARWDGTSGLGWTQLGEGLASSPRALTTLPDGRVFVSGSYNSSTSNSAIRRWSGGAAGSWSPVAAWTSGLPLCIAATPAEGLFIGGSFLNSSLGTNRIARWNGSAWLPMGSGANNTVIKILILPGGDVIAAGLFSTMDGLAVNRIARWDGSTWTPLGEGFNTLVNDIDIMPNGDLIAGGMFTFSGNVRVDHVARWNGVAWVPVGSGVNDAVRAVAVLQSGDLIVGGQFTTAGGVPASRIARWDGSSWSALGAGVNSTVRALAALPNGDFVAGGEFTSAGGIRSSYFAHYSFGGHLPTLTRHPGNLATCPGGSATFTVAASDTGALSYLWRKDGAPIDSSSNPSAATPALTLTGVQVGLAGSYDCVVSNACGSTTSNAATLAVCRADFDCDGTVDCHDYDSFVAAFESGDTGSDFDGDGTTDFFDYDDFVVTFETPC